MKYITSIDDEDIIKMSAPKELINKLMKISEYSHYLSFSFNPFDSDHILSWRTSDETPFFYNPERHHLLLKVDRIPEFEEHNREGILPKHLIYKSFKRDVDRAQFYMCAMYDLFKYEVCIWVSAYTDIEDGDLVPVKVPDDLLEYKKVCCLEHEQKLLKQRRDMRMEISVGMWEDMQKLLRQQSKEIRKLKSKVKV